MRTTQREEMPLGRAVVRRKCAFGLHVVMAPEFVGTSGAWGDSGEGSCAH
jgi:hypothetical protein